MMMEGLEMKLFIWVMFCCVLCSCTTISHKVYLKHDKRPDSVMGNYVFIPGENQIKLIRYKIYQMDLFCKLDRSAPWELCDVRQFVKDRVRGVDYYLDREDGYHYFYDRSYSSPNRYSRSNHFEQIDSYVDSRTFGIDDVLERKMFMEIDASCINYKNLDNTDKNYTNYAQLRKTIFDQKKQYEVIYYTSFNSRQLVQPKDVWTKQKTDKSALWQKVDCDKNEKSFVRSYYKDSRIRYKNGYQKIKQSFFPGTYRLSFEDYKKSLETKKSRLLWQRDISRNPSTDTLVYDFDWQKSLTLNEAKAHQKWFRHIHDNYSKQSIRAVELAFPIEFGGYYRNFEVAGLKTKLHQARVPMNSLNENHFYGLYSFFPYRRSSKWSYYYVMNHHIPYFEHTNQQYLDYLKSRKLAKSCLWDFALSDSSFRYGHREYAGGMYSIYGDRCHEKFKRNKPVPLKRLSMQKFADRLASRMIIDKYTLPDALQSYISKQYSQGNRCNKVRQMCLDTISVPLTMLYQASRQCPALDDDFIFSKCNAVLVDHKKVRMSTNIGPGKVFK